MTIFIAHRGLSALAPENTAAAFDLAWAYDCAGIELDVQVSRDGFVVVHHDADLQRSANAAVAIAELDYATLLSYDVGQCKGDQFSGERIPLLADVLASMPAGKVIQIEVKAEVTRIDTVIALLKETNRNDLNIYVISFDPAQLAKLQQQLPDFPALWVIDTDDAKDVSAVCERALALGFSGIDVHHAVIDEAYVQHVHEAGLLLGCWTVNDVARMHELAALGVDMIASDCAHLAIEQ